MACRFCFFTLQLQQMLMVSFGVQMTMYALKRREWLAICLFFALFMPLVVTILINQTKGEGVKRVRQGSIVVKVVADGLEPQKIELCPGAKLSDLFALLEGQKELIIKGRPFNISNFDIGRLPLERLLRSGEVIILPEKGRSSVFVTGAVVEEKVISFRGRVSICDIASEVVLNQHADPKWLVKKRRYLVDGETLIVPTIVPKGPNAKTKQMN